LTEDAAKQDALFVNLILVFKSAAMQQMGKLMNPITGETDRNLDQARFSVDTLEMLKEKTRGNLSDDLARLLDSTLLELRMNYVEEAEAEAKAAEAGEAEKVKAGEGEKTEPGTAGEPGPEDRAQAGSTGPAEKRASSEGAGDTDQGDTASAGPAGGKAARRETAPDTGATDSGKSRGSRRPRKGRTGKRGGGQGHSK
jgi:hypothetical protein